MFNRRREQKSQIHKNSAIYLNTQSYMVLCHVWIAFGKSLKNSDGRNQPFRRQIWPYFQQTFFNVIIIRNDVLPRQQNIDVLHILYYYIFKFLSRCLKAFVDKYYVDIEVLNFFFPQTKYAVANEMKKFACSKRKSKLLKAICQIKFNNTYT